MSTRQTLIDDSAHLLRQSTDAPCTRSSVERELQFLMSPPVHHYALIAVILRLNGRAVPEGFGLAPSTLRYREANHNCAP